MLRTTKRSNTKLFPWLAALVVVADQRRKGLSRLLVNRMVRETRRLGFPEFFLGTDMPEFYLPLGWGIDEEFSDNMRIMRFALTTNA